MEEILVAESPPQPVRAVVVAIPHPKLSETFLRTANRDFPLPPHAAHLKRIRRTLPGETPPSSLLLLLSLSADEKAPHHINANANANANANVDANVDSIESAEKYTATVADRAPRSSPSLWDEWNAVWPLAAPRPRAPAPLPPAEVAVVRRLLAETVLPLALRLVGRGALGIAAALVDAAGTVHATSEGAPLMRRSDAAAREAYGAPVHKSTGAEAEKEEMEGKHNESTQRCVIEHPVTYVLKELARKQSGRGTSETVASNSNDNNNEANDVEPYLANGLDIVVSHEPCAMCAMALVHSRVRRAYYCFPNPAHGGLGSVFAIHAVPSLNHHFRAFRCDMDDEWGDLNIPISTAAGLEANRVLLLSHLRGITNECVSPLQVHVQIHDGRRDTLLRHVKCLYDTALQHSSESIIDVIPLLPAVQGEGGDAVPFTSALMTPDRGFEPLYKHVALGGTFDRLHGGHKLLLTTALCFAKNGLYVGVAKDELLQKKAFGLYIQSFDARCVAVERFLRSIRSDLSFDIFGINDVSGGTDRIAELEALIVSPETAPALETINAARESNKLAPMEPILVPFVGSSSTDRISSTELRKIHSQKNDESRKSPEGTQ